MEELINAFQKLQSSVAEALAAAGVDATKTRESARVLGLNRGLTWRISRLLRANDDLSAVSDVPGRESMVRLFDTCAGLGASSATVETALRAVDEFEAAVEACAGDRKTLTLLIANRGESTSIGEADRTRRRLFEGACGVWGVQARVRFVTVFAFPSPEDSNLINAAHTTGYIDFRRLGNRTWPMVYEVVHNSAGELAPFRRTALMPGSGMGDAIPLMQEFCEPQNPPISTRVSQGFRIFELESGPVGNEGLTTCVFGTLLHGLYPRYPAEPETAGFMLLIQTPVEHVIFDLFLHRDLDVIELPRTELLDRLTFPHGNNESEFDLQRMPLAERPRRLAPGAAGAFTHLIPWYPRLLGQITERIGQPINAFDGSRFELAYPPISTTLSRRFDLTPRKA